MDWTRPPRSPRQTQPANRRQSVDFQTTLQARFCARCGSKAGILHGMAQFRRSWNAHFFGTIVKTGTNPKIVLRFERVCPMFEDSQWSPSPGGGLGWLRLRVAGVGFFLWGAVVVPAIRNLFAKSVLGLAMAGLGSVASGQTPPSAQQTPRGCAAGDAACHANAAVRATAARRATAVSCSVRCGTDAPVRAGACVSGGHRVHRSAPSDSFGRVKG